MMTLYSSQNCAECHMLRFLLAEKGVEYEVRFLEGDERQQELLDLNPYSLVPTLVDRDLVLYETRVAAEYVDERFPHPPLMPLDPAGRAATRLAVFRVLHDWYSLWPDLVSQDSRRRREARKMLRERLLAGSPVFGARRFFLSDEFSLADAFIAPMLWRLPFFQVELPADATVIDHYAAQIFARPAFRQSLTSAEQAMRK